MSTTIEIVAIPAKITADGIGYETEWMDFNHRENVKQAIQWSGKIDPEKALALARDHASLAVAERPGRYPCHLAIVLHVAKGQRAPQGFKSLRDAYYLPAAEFKAAVAA